MEKPTKISEEKVPIKAKLSFSFGGLGNGLLNSLVFANLTFFYNIKLGADKDILGIGWLIFMFWNTINDPIASYIIDNTRTKLGRRIPYIRYGSFFYGLAFLFCWFPIAPLDNELLLFINFLAALFLLDTAYTFVGACFFSLPNEIAVSAKERASLGAYSAVIGFINIILGLVLPIILFTIPEGIPSYFAPVIILIAVISTLLLFGTSFFYKENLFAQLQPHEPFVEGLRLTLKNKAFWIFMIPAFCIYLVYPNFQTALLYYLDYIVAGQNIIYFILTFVIGIVVGMFINVKKIDVWYPKKTMMINLSLIIIGFAGLFIVAYNALLSSIPYFIIGVGFAGAMVSNPVIMGDIIDNDELITGKRREAIYGGVNALVQKPAISIANWLFLLILGVFGFKEEVSPQSDMALFGIIFAFCVIPIIFLIIAVIGMKFYPLDGPKWRDKKEKVHELHKVKEMKYKEKNEIE
ncbi:MAG: MFS transporter [Candidatus Lokiarchaeota archaeon]|nr:MFS transporter [Candidatus Lokiarchaeota archaeon]MBD3201183.1 MFS transporter [Candidatus Lokiarchaeota archaeon]